MSTEKQATQVTATESEATKSKATSNKGSSEDKASSLLKFDEANEIATGKDINQKITSLDSDLAHLRAELAAINNSVEEGLDRLSDTDTDLTAKVSETYKRLGEIDNSYKSLVEISTRIDTDIQRLNGDVSTVAQQSATGIKTLEQSTIAQSNEFSQKNLQVVTRVNHLVETSKLSGELLTQKIKITTEKMLQMEKQVVSEIEGLASQVTDKTKAIEVSVESNKAKILKLQNVDEAIIKRATTLEISSAELSVKSQDIQSSVAALQLSSDGLSASLGTLSERTRALEDITKNQGSLISSLQKAGSDLGEKLAFVSGRESKHFTIVTTGFLLLLIVTVVIYFSQQSQFHLTEATIAQRNDVVDFNIVRLQQTQDSAAAVANESLLTLDEKVESLNAAMSQQIAAADLKIQNMQDQVQSVDARLTIDSPFSQIGSDNIIHGEQWIAALPSQNFVVQLAYVGDKKEMFELAQRYNFHLKDSLSYFATQVNGTTNYVLLSGNYATQQQAQNKINSLPYSIDRQQPVVRQLQAVQQYIAGKS